MCCLPVLTSCIGRRLRWRNSWRRSSRWSRNGTITRMPLPGCWPILLRSGSLRGWMTGGRSSLRSSAKLPLTGNPWTLNGRSWTKTKPRRKTAGLCSAFGGVSACLGLRPVAFCHLRDYPFQCVSGNHAECLSRGFLHRLLFLILAVASLSWVEIASAIWANSVIRHCSIPSFLRPTACRSLSGSLSRPWPPPQWSRAFLCCPASRGGILPGRWSAPACAAFRISRTGLCPCTPSRKPRRCNALLSASWYLPFVWNPL